MIWRNRLDLDSLNSSSQNTLAEALGIIFTEIGDDFVKCTMPVDNRTKQPFGLLHGGASAALAENMGSVASVMCIEDINKQGIVGVELNANHIRPATRGLVTGTIKPFKVGRKMHVWGIEIHDEEDRLICVSRLTIMVIERN